MTAKTQAVWEGAKGLRRLLVPLADLEPFPGNPRKGDVGLVRESLRRFGQVRAIVVDAGNPARIVAGHHVALAASEEGWTHVAAQPAEFADEDEARRFLLIDNRSHDRGDYDLELLHAQMLVLRETPAGLDGTGYDDLYADMLARDLAMATNPPDPVEPPRRDLPDDVTELVLIYNAAQRTDVERWLRAVSETHGAAGTSEAVYIALRIAAEAS